MRAVRNVWKHFKTITHHRRLVRHGCFRVGLYWQGLTHDLSKYSPIEFWTGVRYYQGNRSPNTAEREAKGINHSILHVDFMVGSDDMSIRGQKQDGAWEDVFVNGRWAW